MKRPLTEELVPMLSSNPTSPQKSRHRWFWLLALAVLAAPLQAQDAEAPAAPAPAEPAAVEPSTDESAPAEPAPPEPAPPEPAPPEPAPPEPAPPEPAPPEAAASETDDDEFAEDEEYEDDDESAEDPAGGQVGDAEANPDEGLPSEDSLGATAAEADVPPAPVQPSAAGQGDRRPQTIQLWRGTRSPVRYDYSLREVATQKPTRFKGTFETWKQTFTSGMILNAAAAKAVGDPVRGVEDAVQVLMDHVRMSGDKEPVLTLAAALHSDEDKSNASEKRYQAFVSGLTAGLRDVALDPTPGGLAMAHLDSALAGRTQRWMTALTRRMARFQRTHLGANPGAGVSETHARAYVGCLAVVEVAMGAARSASSEGWEFPGRSASTSGPMDSAELARMAVLGKYQNYATGNVDLAIPPRLAFQPALPDSAARPLLMAFFALLLALTFKMILGVGRKPAAEVKVEDPLKKMAD